MADFGYDVADYCGIDPLFGTLADFDALVAEAHARGLKVILDFVPNHTSDRASVVRREPVVARQARSATGTSGAIPRPDGGPPNNWLSDFGGSAWTWDETTGQYYFHAFLTEQPDLNWRNPAVQAAMLDVLRFWLDRGVDGFRVDVIWHLIKDEQFRDNPPNPDYVPAASRPRSAACRGLLRRPARGARHHRRDARASLDAVRRARADRRDLPADRAARRPTTARRTRRRRTCRSTSS